MVVGKLIFIKKQSHLSPLVDLRLLAGKTSVVDLGMSAVTFVFIMIVVVHRWQNLAETMVLSMVLAGAGALSTIDIRSHRLPNSGTLTMALLSTFGLSITGLFTDQAHRIPGAAATGLGLTAVFLVVNLTASMGMGDVKYAYTVGFVTGWFGLPTLITALIVTSLSAAVGAVIVLAISRNASARIPYGPYMSLGLATSLTLT